MNRLGRIARSVEFTVAGLITAGIVALHLNVVQHAGPLWRDEISSLRVATMPTLGGSWSMLVYDPVPALFFSLMRLWNWLCAGAADQDWRYLGFVIGIGILAALWFTAWTLKKAPPLWALLLFGLSPVALVWGDSMRAYGIGCLFNILAVGFIFRLTNERPSAMQIAAGIIGALLSVHCLFPNSLLLFATIAGGIVVALLQRWWRTVIILLGVGLTAALSLLPYAGIIHSTQSWSPLAKAGVSFIWIFQMLFQALQSGGVLAAGLWIAGAAVTVLVCLLALMRPHWIGLNLDDKRLAIYSAITLTVATIGTIWFFAWVGWATSIWYYLPVMATAVVCIDGASKTLRKHAILSMANSLLVLFAAMALSPLALKATNVRLTNIDVTTAVIEQHANPDDLIVVDNYFYGISFNRYYHGKAPWVSVPDLTDFTLHRWDLLTDRMRQPQPIEPVLARMNHTLQTGHDVYIVGFALLGQDATAPADLPIAPAEGTNWCLWPYLRRWTQQVGYAAKTHAVHGWIIPVPHEQPVSVAENVRAVIVTGWKDPRVAALPSP